MGVAALAGEYHSVVARAAAAKAVALGLPFLCSSAVLDALTEKPTGWVARLSPAQSRGWKVYAEFLISEGHTRIAVATAAGVYWESGTRILRDCFASHGGTVVELDMCVLDSKAVCDELVFHQATAVLLLIGFPEPAVSIVRSVCQERGFWSGSKATALCAPSPPRCRKGRPLRRLRLCGRFWIGCASNRLGTEGLETERRGGF